MRPPEICPVCHGSRWVSPWRKAEDQLPPVDKVHEYRTIIVPVLHKNGKQWFPAYYDFELKTWIRAYETSSDPAIENIEYWQLIEPPEET
jgi:hypothetical protein